jgi:hypothetical protein
MPAYAWLGLGLMLLSESLMLQRVEPFWSWHTPIAWTGYLLLADGLARRWRGDSWLWSAGREFLFLAALSVPLWLVFEGFNLFIRNWYYVNLPDALVLRWLGYVWSFATIWPAIFLTGELVGIARGTAPRPPSRRPAAMTAGMWTSVVSGAAMLVWPILRPSPYLAAPVWLGFIFLLDPINARAGDESLLGDWRAGRTDRAGNLALAGLACGVVWEFWNYWARTKWIYAVPILPDLKVFEMPLPGYLGFPAFALECFVMYVLVRRWLWRGPVRPVSL